MQLSDTLALSSDVVAREVAGETVLLDLASGTYFGLNEVGSRIWHWLENGDAATLDELCRRLQQEYGIAEEVAEHDVLALARNLSEHGLASVPAA